MKRYLTGCLVWLACAGMALAQSGNNVLAQLGARGTTMTSSTNTVNGTNVYYRYLVLLGTNGQFETGFMPQTSNNTQTALNHVRFVDAVNGGDNTNVYDGSLLRPYRTITNAMNYNPTTNMVFVLAPGSYASPNVTNPAVTNMTLIGMDPDQTALTGQLRIDNDRPFVLNAYRVTLNEVKQMQYRNLTVGLYDRVQVLDQIHRQYPTSINSWLTLYRDPSVSMAYAIVTNNSTEVLSHNATNVGYTAQTPSNWTNTHSALPTQVEQALDLLSESTAPTGTVTGQMLYWTGTNWMLVAAGGTNQVLYGGAHPAFNNVQITFGTNNIPMDFVPATNNMYSIGNTNIQWLYGWFGSNVFIGGIAVVTNPVAGRLTAGDTNTWTQTSVGLPVETNRAQTAEAGIRTMITGPDVYAGEFNFGKSVVVTPPWPSAVVQSLSVWLYATNLGAWIIYGDTALSTPPGSFRINTAVFASSPFTVTPPGGVGVDIGSGRYYATNQWVHVVATSFGGNTFVYTNNVLVGMGVVALPIFSVVGASMDGQYFSGYMDELALFTRMLSADERAILYNSGTGGYARLNTAPWNLNLAVLYHFREGSGTTVNDDSGNLKTGMGNLGWASGKVLDDLEYHITLERNRAMAAEALAVTNPVAGRITATDTSYWYSVVDTNVVYINPGDDFTAKINANADTGRVFYVNPGTAYVHNADIYLYSDMRILGAGSSAVKITRPVVAGFHMRHGNTNVMLSGFTYYRTTSFPWLVGVRGHQNEPGFDTTDVKLRDVTMNCPNLYSVEAGSNTLHYVTVMDSDLTPGSANLFYSGSSANSTNYIKLHNVEAKAAVGTNRMYTGRWVQDLTTGGYHSWNDNTQTIQDKQEDYVDNNALWQDTLYINEGDDFYSLWKTYARTGLTVRVGPGTYQVYSSSGNALTFYSGMSLIGSGKENTRLTGVDDSSRFAFGYDSSTWPNGTPTHCTNVLVQDIGFYNPSAIILVGNDAVLYPYADLSWIRTNSLTMRDVVSPSGISMLAIDGGVVSNTITTVELYGCDLNSIGVNLGITGPGTNLTFTFNCDDTKIGGTLYTKRFYKATDVNTWIYQPAISYEVGGLLKSDTNVICLYPDDDLRTVWTQYARTNRIFKLASGTFTLSTGVPLPFYSGMQLVGSGREQTRINGVDAVGFFLGDTYNIDNCTNILVQDITFNNASIGLIGCTAYGGASSKIRTNSVTARNIRASDEYMFGAPSDASNSQSYVTIYDSRFDNAVTFQHDASFYQNITNYYTLYNTEFMTFYGPVTGGVYGVQLRYDMVGSTPTNVSGYATVFGGHVRAPYLPTSTNGFMLSGTFWNSNGVVCVWNP